MFSHQQHDGPITEGCELCHQRGERPERVATWVAKGDDERRVLRHCRNEIDRRLAEDGVIDRESLRHAIKRRVMLGANADRTREWPDGFGNLTLEGGRGVARARAPSDRRHTGAVGPAIRRKGVDGVSELGFGPTGHPDSDRDAVRGESIELFEASPGGLSPAAAGEGRPISGAKHPLEQRR